MRKRRRDGDITAIFIWLPCLIINMLKTQIYTDFFFFFNNVTVLKKYILAPCSIITQKPSILTCSKLWLLSSGNGNHCFAHYWERKQISKDISYIKLFGIYKGISAYAITNYHSPCPPDKTRGKQSEWVSLAETEAVIESHT